MPRTPRPLTSAMAAALAAGAVVAVTAVAEPGADRPVRAAAAAGWRPAPPPTRDDAVRAAAVARDDAEGRVARALGIERGRVRQAERAVVARRLGEEVQAQRLTAAQRDALLACFDSPVACPRGGLPVGGLRGVGGPPAFATVPPARFAPGPPPVARPFPAPRRPARPPRRGRRPARRIPPPLPAPPAGGLHDLARELGVPVERLARALRPTRRSAPPALDPDGVPLGLPVLPLTLVVPGRPVLVAPPPAPRPRTVPPRPAPARTTP
ncbi:MAG TPA: hypothetical protein VD931_18810 [Baekduia sp.]|nr:hypothetical protein [Baekduia sp.]